MKMLFSLTGEIGLVVIGLLWVANKWFDSFIDTMTLLKDSNDEKKDLPESIKHLYS